MLDYLFGRSKKSDEGGRNAQESPPPDKIESPFPFLKNVSEDRQNIVHDTIKSDLMAAAKSKVIEAVLEDSEPILNAYRQWANEIALEIPNEVKHMINAVDCAMASTYILCRDFDAAVLCISSKDGKEAFITWLRGVVCGGRFYDVVFDKAREILMVADNYAHQKNAVHYDLTRIESVSALPSSFNKYKSTEHMHVSSTMPYPPPGLNIEPAAPGYTHKGVSSNHENILINFSDENSVDMKGDNSVKSHGNTYAWKNIEDHMDECNVVPEQDSTQEKLKTLNILLLGETGVGKTTFINSLANYLQFDTLDKALSGQPTVLVDSAFHVTNDKNKIVTVKAVKGKKKGEPNERLGQKGTSSTQDPMDHIINWTEDGEVKEIRIIDTPGINDTRGTEQDEKNFEKILKHIAGVGELHAICILMKPNESKFTVGFRYCIDNLLVKLHKDATKNIFFCFTNTRSTLYRPGDTLSTLCQYLNKLKDEEGIIITADRNNIFCFDNECFRYLFMVRQLKCDPDRATFSEGWQHNVKESYKLLMKAQGMTAHSVEDTVTINNTRRLVTFLARPLAEMARNHIVNRKLIEDRIAEIEKIRDTGRSLRSVLQQDQVVMVSQKLKEPRTVCTSPHCVKYVKINAYETQIEPLKICHDNCTLTGIKERSVNNSSLNDCYAFAAIKGKCMVCGCPPNKHMHITYELRPETKQVKDASAKERMYILGDQKKAVEALLKENQEELDELEFERDSIRDCTAEFSVFLAVNSVKNSFDPFADYLDHLLQEEENKSINGGGAALFYEIFVMKDDYEQLVKHIMDDIKAGRRAPLTTSQLHNKVNSLRKLKVCGKIINEVMPCFSPDENVQVNMNKNDTKPIDDDVSSMTWSRMAKSNGRR